MPNFSNDALGKVDAENLCKTRMAANTWVVGHVGVDKSANVVVRFIRFMAPTSDATRAYGGWEESRDTAAT
jgi:hypothetical protein